MVDKAGKLFFTLTELGLQDKLEDKRSGELLFDIFMHLFENLEDEEVTLILNLLKKYRIFRSDSCAALLNSSFEDAFAMAKINPSKVYYLPIATEADLDSEKHKSGHAMLYLVNDVSLMRVAPCIANKTKHLVQNYKRSNVQNSGSELYIFLDDFIGTGDTALATVKEFMHKFTIDPKRIYVLSLVIMEEGWHRLVKEGINIGAAIVLKKGISDSNTPDIDKDDALYAMECIEEKAYVPAEYRFGYGWSEALVTLIKTPNNTFPFFWYNGPSKRVVPFPR